jgi:hypothetical protein
MTKRGGWIVSRDQLESSWPRFDWKKEAKSFCEWLDQWWRGLVAVAVILSMLLLFYYTLYEHVSLSISELSALSIFPTVFLAVVLLGVFSVLFLLLPVVLLLAPLGKDERTLYELLVNKNHGVLNKRNLLPRWVAVAVALALFFVGLVLLVDWLGASDSAINIAVGSILILMIGLIILVIGKQNGGLKGVSGNLWLCIGIMPFVQMLFVLVCAQISVRIVPSWVQPLGGTPLNLVISGAVIVAAAIGAILQAIVIDIYVEGREQGKPLWVMARNILWGSLLIVMFPPVGAAFTGVVFTVTASGGRNCVVLVLSKPKYELVNPLLVDDGQNGELFPQSKPLRILLNASDAYQIRLQGESDTVRFVPRGDVRGMKSCPPPDLVSL